MKQLTVRVSAGEFLRLAAAAEALAMTPTAWVRYQALRAAEAAGSAAASPPPYRPPPPQDPPAKLTRTAGTRFSDDQFAVLKDHALACGLTVTAFIRQVVLGANPVARRPLARSAIVAVNRVGNNLNQLVHLAHTGTVLAPDLLSAVLAVRTELRALRDVLLAADLAETGAAAGPPEPPA